MIGIRWSAVLLLGLLMGSVAWWAWAGIAHVYTDHREGHVVRERVQALWDLEVRRAQASQTPGNGAP